MSALQSGKDAFNRAKLFVEKMNWTSPSRSLSLAQHLCLTPVACVTSPTMELMSILQTLVLGKMSCEA